MFWHGCLEGYQEPFKFRSNLNATVQALRNVTFVLQKEKRLIAGFDEWYSPHQAALGEDEVMRWVVKSRNRIVKEGDLETDSSLRAWLIATYFDATAAMEASLPASEALRMLDDGEVEKQISAPPRFGTGEVLGMFVNNAPKRVVDDSVIAIERRWVDRALPDRELLDAVAYAYARLNEILKDAHAHTGADLACDAIPASECQEFVAFGDPLLGGRSPCMVTSRHARTATVRVRDGEATYGGRVWPFVHEPGLEALAVERYGDIRPDSADVETILDLVPYFTKIAIRILETDTDHGWFLHPFKGTVPYPPVMLEARDKSEKFDLAQRVAEMVAANGIDGLLMTGEYWGSPMTLEEDGGYVPPSEHPEKFEMVVMHAETSDGALRTVSIPFKRRDGQPIEIGEPVEDLGMGKSMNFMDPVRAVWRRWHDGDE